MKRGAPLKRNKPLRPASFAWLRPLQIRCCGKKRFATREAAEAALLRIARTTSSERYPQYAYECPEGWWHLTKQAPPRDSRTGRRDTGPDRNTRLLVLERDEYRCAVCGQGVLEIPFSIHHRRNRGSGGSSDPLINAPSNLLTVCGTGTTLCHGWIGSSPAEALEHGYAVSLNSREATTDVPVLHAALGGVFLLDDGTVRPVPTWEDAS